MIYDRTQKDAEEARRIRGEKVQNSQELTDQDIDTLERGTLTINTLNRIEAKQQELVAVLNGMGYYGLKSLQSKEWEYKDIFTEPDFVRILKNCEMLKTVFFAYRYTPITPPPRYHYNNINSIEKILHDIDTMATEVRELYSICGAYECGEGGYNG